MHKTCMRFVAMFKFSTFKPLLTLAFKKVYDVFFISIQLGKGWILSKPNVNLINT